MLSSAKPLAFLKFSPASIDQRKGNRALVWLGEQGRVESEIETNAR